MKITTITTSRVISTLLVVSALGFLTVLTLRLQSEIVAAEMRRFRSYQLAQALRLSSDELSRMARSYVITGEQQFRQRYFTLLAQRQAGHLLTGKGLAGWNPDSPPEPGAPPPTPPVDPLAGWQAEGFTAAEIALLQLAWQRSEQLARRETAAFAAIEAASGNDSPAGRARREAAIRQLHDAEYHRQKAAIMVPIERFLQQLDQRSARELDSLQARQRNYLLADLVLSVSLFIGLLLFTFYIHRKVLGPLAQLRQQALALSRGQYASRVNIDSRNELALLGQTFNQMAGAIERDIAARRQLQQELETLACTDFLTQLANRRHFIDSASSALARARRSGEALAVCMLDIDHFKQINDQHGHAAGDAVLQHLAELMRRTLREIDLCGRIGGEEFALLLPGTEAAEAMRALERLCSAVVRFPVYFESGLQIAYTISAGVAVSQHDDLGLDSLLNQADAALYAAKAAGRNRVMLYRPPADVPPADQAAA